MPERPVPRWSSRSTRKSCSARLSQAAGAPAGRGLSKPGPPCRKTRNGLSRPSGAATSRAKTVRVSSLPGCSGTSSSCSVSRRPEAAITPACLSPRPRSDASDCTQDNVRRTEIEMNDTTETAILAGGCFWGVEELLRHRDGVISTRVGYTGGENDHPTYRNHPGHAEAVEIVFDPERISYRDILEFFFQIHDPSTKDRQGNDIGSSYRSEIFYLSDEQRRVAEETIADVDASGLWPGKVVTEVSEAVPFWEAEPEHQDYLQHYPNGYTCHFPRPDWKLPHRETASSS